MLRKRIRPPHPDLQHFDLTHGAGAFDPAAFLSVITLLAAVAALAAFIPAPGPTLVEPSQVLRDN
jgi:hypothetical protein